MAFSVPTGATQDSRGCLQHLDARPRALSLGWRELAHRAARPARISLANRRVLGKTQQTGENPHSNLWKCNSASRLSRFIASRKSEPLRGQKTGRGNRANHHLINGYKKVYETF